MIQTVLEWCSYLVFLLWFFIQVVRVVFFIFFYVFCWLVFYQQKTMLFVWLGELYRVAFSIISMSTLYYFFYQFRLLCCQNRNWLFLLFLWLKNKTTISLLLAILLFKRNNIILEIGMQVAIFPQSLHNLKSRIAIFDPAIKTCILLLAITFHFLLIESYKLPLLLLKNHEDNYFMQLSHHFLIIFTDYILIQLLHQLAWHFISLIYKLDLWKCFIGN